MSSAGSFLSKLIYTNAALLTGAGVALFAVDRGYFKPTSIFNNSESKNNVDNESVFSSQISNLKLVKDLRADTGTWRELPFTFGLEDELAQKSFLHSTFNQPDHLLAVPKMFVNKDKKKVIYLFYIGKKLCGHPGIMHGGVQAMLYDEAMARPALLNLPRNTGFTAYLNIQYKKPVIVDQILIMRADLEEIVGRKATVKASIENVNGDVLSTAESLFVSPSDKTLLKDNTEAFSTV
ncbi:Acyl-coenzyme A thioesterase THEM4 [Smittium mucronatum]|uniref:Acyl-coenzyme A thioesterase THEM4 n=1 Tax=Smittium mucronatum TaxID=133383 RepID=A0A1R0H9J5_9FUNG|nr:Acyl-coenzyme A thioesterase THEM4 [Smittium mucronatum]